MAATPRSGGCSAGSRTSARDARRRRHHRLQRHRQRHLPDTGNRRHARPAAGPHDRRVARRRCARVCRCDGVRGARRARPKAGGEYVYLREAFGPAAAFLTGWTSFVAGFSGAVAASAVGFAASLGRFVPFAADRHPLVSAALGPRDRCRDAAGARRGRRHCAALRPCTCAASAPDACCRTSSLARRSRRCCCSSASVSASEQGDAGALRQGAPHVTAAGWVLALVPVMFSYSGWNAAAYVAEEVRDPDALRSARTRARHGRRRRRVRAAERALCRTRCRSSELARLERQRRRRDRRPPVRPGGGQPHGGARDGQHRGEHQRDDLRGPARLLRDGAGRRVPAGGGPRAPAIPNAGGRDRGAGGVEQRCSCSRAASPS